MDNKTIKDISGLFRKWLINYRSGDGGSALNDDDLEIAFFVGYNSGQSEELDLQSQLDEVTKVKEKYREALELISKNKHVDYDENHYECGNYDDSYNHGYEVSAGECGHIAREALSGGEE